MNNEIRKFDFRGAALRTLTDEAGEPWFVAKDVCDILGTDTRDLHKILESDEITNVDSIHIAQNGGKAPLIISEPGLYRLVMKSRKPEAKEFQRWVTHEVLPSIRKHGGYMAGQERMTPEQMALASMRWLQSKVDEQAKQLKAPGRQGPVRQRGRNREDVHPCGRFREDPEKQRHRHRPTAPVRLAPRAWMAHQGQGLQLEHAHTEGDGPSPVRDQGDDHQPLGRAHHDQQDAEDDRQGADVFRQTVPRETNTGSGCVMSETWLPACISLTAGLFSLSLALLRILVDLDPIGWILSLGECQESGKADAVGDVQITIIPVSNVRTGISSELANAVSFPVSDDAAVPGATHESNRNGTRGASNASAASSNGGVSL